VILKASEKDFGLTALLRLTDEEVVQFGISVGDDCEIEINIVSPRKKT
jgi:hypothetical protein